MRLHRHLPVRVLLLVSFVEGAAVMVIELLGAKTVAPYYGTSLYVWASVLGVTVGALALGYFLGGVISRRYPAERSLFVLLLIGAGFTLLAPFLSPTIWPATEALGVRLGSLVAVLIYLLPSVTCLGAVSPVIIQLISRDVVAAGQSAGTVYAISTVGGVLATLLAGFFLIPEIGLRVTAVLTGGSLGLIGLCYFLFFSPKGSAVSAQPAEAPSSDSIRARAEVPEGRRSTPAPLVSLPVKILLGVAFIEGGAVMVMELLGAKITAPYYGASLYVWASVLAVTLGALALGYFLGGFLSRKHPGESTLFVVLFLAGFLTATAPLIAPPVFLVTHFLGVRAGSLAAVLVYVLPPVACMGMVSPQITQMINRYRDEVGRSAGTVYAISTVGGILATFLAGFYLIPEIGIRATALITGGLLGAAAVAYFAFVGNSSMVIAGIVLAGVPVLFQPVATESDNARVLYRSSGILGQWSVLDYGPWREKESERVERRLLLNGIDQTVTRRGTEPLSLWTYPHQIGAYASMKPEGSKALLLGMGGGSVAYEMNTIGLDLDIVELDERVRYISQTYFGFEPATARLFIDDARHYMRSTAEKYDLVVIDLLIGEVQPTHVFSLEGFEDLKRILNEDALVIINFQGNIDQSARSLGPRSIYKTLEVAGFFVSYYTTKDESDPNQDVFFLASQRRQDYRNLMIDLRYNKLFSAYKFFPGYFYEYRNLIRTDAPRLDDAYVLVDDQPRLELLNTANILAWRESKVTEHMRPMILGGVAIF
jgi:spermidine synthase